MTYSKPNLRTYIPGLPVVVLVALASARQASTTVDDGQIASDEESSTTEPREMQPSPRPSLTETEEPISMEGCVEARSLNVRSAPGMGISVIAGATEGDCFLFNGISSDGEWARADISELGGQVFGWMAIQYVELEDVPSGVLEVEIQPTEVPVGPSPTFTRWPTATSLQSSPTITRWPTATTGAITTAARSGAGSSCHPNYTNVCLQSGIGDYDCAGGSGNGPNYVRGPVVVSGSDPFGLDGDGDGVGCE